MLDSPWISTGIKLGRHFCGLAQLSSLATAPHGIDASIQVNLADGNVEQ